MNIYRRFNWIFLAVAFLPVLAIGLFNLVIDPYGMIDSPTFVGINRLKVEQANHVRLFKAIDIIRFKPKTILLGSSTTMLGLTPNHPALLDRKNAYNLGILGGNMYELRRYLHHVITNQPQLKQVVIGLDFYMLNGLRKNAPDFTEGILDKTLIPLQNVLDVIFSVQVFASSKRTIAANIEEPEVIPYFFKGQSRERVFTNDSMKNITMIERFTMMIKNYFTDPGYYKSYLLSQNFLNEFKTMIHLCQQHHIDLKLFISPVHATQLEAIHVAGLWSDLEQSKREITKIIPVWDFSDYNSITTEPISNDMKNFIDGVHYRQEVGDLVLNRLFHYREETVPQDFGVWMTQANIESHIAAIRKEREIWVENNPDLVKLVQAVKASLLHLKDQ
jgi:hypothetical protein